MGREVRKDAILYLQLKCKDGTTALVPLFFSFRIETSPKGPIASSFLPPGVEKFLLQNEFFVVKDVKDYVLIKARLSRELPAGKYLVEFLGEQLVENRLCDRFKFCPEELGEFELRIKDWIINRVKVVDISLSGIKLSVSEKVDLKRDDLLLITQGTKVMSVKAIRVKREGGVFTVGAKIMSTNFNLVNFIMDHYVRLVKKLL